MLRQFDSETHEDHFVIISDDTKHDVPFLELANKKIYEHYRGFLLIETSSLAMVAPPNPCPKLQYIFLCREKDLQFMPTLKHRMGKVSQMD